MRKKLKTGISALLLMSFVLSACTAGNGDAKSSENDVLSQEITVDENGRKMIGNMYLEGLPIVKEKETFTIFCDESIAEPQKIIYEMLEEETNIHVEVIGLPYEAAKEKLNILLNSGEYPDVIGGWILGDRDILVNGMQEGVFLQLDQMIAEYAPKIEEVLDLKGVRDTMTAPDGHIYTIPYVAAEPLTTFRPWINVEWLEKLGLEMPTTTEEFTEVLRRFKTDDPNGNGIQDEIPFSIDPDNKHIGLMAGYFGVDVTAWNQPRYYTLIDGKPVFSGQTEAFKEFMKWFAELSKEGLVDPELFTQDKGAWKAKGNKDLYGCAIAYNSGEFAVKDESPGVDKSKRRTAYDALPVLKSDYTDKPVFHRVSYESGKTKRNGKPEGGVTTFRTQAVITNKAKNPAMILRYYDNLFQPDNGAQATWGPIGIMIEKIGEGEYQYIDKETIPKDVQDKYAWQNMYNQSMPKYVQGSEQPLPAAGVAEEYEENDALIEEYQPYLNELFPKLWYSEEDMKRASIIETDIRTYMEKTIAEWATGQKDIDAEWENHLKALNDLGLQEWQTIIEKSYNQYLENQKKNES